MNKKLTILSALLVAAIFLGVFQFSFAQGNINLANKKNMQQSESFRHDKREMMQLENNPNMKIKGLWESLNLSQEQKTELSKINLNFQKETLKFKNEIQLSQLGVKELFLDEEFDLNKIRLELQKIADLEVETKVKGFEAYLAAKVILTPEQIEKLPKNIPFFMIKSGRFSMSPQINKGFK